VSEIESEKVADALGEVLRRRRPDLSWQVVPDEGAGIAGTATGAAQVRGLVSEGYKTNPVLNGGAALPDPDDSEDSG
jgi:hypothetical protein